jgi:hypothetical protein
MSITDDIRELIIKYGDKKGIPTADQIMRVVAELEKRRVICNSCINRPGCPVWKGESGHVHQNRKDKAWKIIL